LWAKPALKCEKEIKFFLQEGKNRKPLNRNFTAGIIPHAGWFFSRSIACNVLNALKETESAVAAAKKLGSRQAELITYATSYDKRPDDSSVGYAGIVL